MMEARVRTTWKLISPVLCLWALAAAAEDSKTAVDLTMHAHVFKPKQVAVTPQRISALKLPAGFRISVYADGLDKPRILAAAPDGTLYVTRREPGDVWMLKDVDHDGRAEVKQKLAERKDLHGIALHGSNVYLVSSKEILKASRKQDGTFGPLKTLADDLPAGGQHNNRTVAVGPDAKLYVSIGSTCNACDETTPESATLLQLGLDGKGRRIYARGLRNTIGFAWDPRTGALWGMDHGIDWLGDDDQKEELNRIEDGKQYGWPYVFADGKANPANDPPDGLTHAQWAERSQGPVLLHTAHSAPMQMAFYTGTQFSNAYQNGAFLALHGSWNRKPPSGYEVVFVRFNVEGKPVAFEPFLSGFLTTANKAEGSTYFGRPFGLAVAPDGSLFVSDDSNGVVYHVQYQSSAQAPSP
jgi:glucose/arabinose dehydrogenase